MAIAAVLGFALASDYLAPETLYVSLYGEVVDGTTLRDESCHDLAYPEIRCFDTIEEMFDDQIRGWPDRAEILEGLGEPAFVVYRGARHPLSDWTTFEACNALGYPEIRCFDSVRESILDQVENFPGQARSARLRLAALEAED